MACLLIGVIVGLINGFLIVYMRVPDLLATLGMMFLLVGLQRIPTEGRSIATGMTMPDGSVASGTFSAGLPGARPPPLRLLHPEPDPGLGGGASDARAC